MDLIRFRSALVTRNDGDVLIALFDGDEAMTKRAVALLICSRETAASLTRALASFPGSSENEK